MARQSPDDRERGAGADRGVRQAGAGPAPRERLVPVGALPLANGSGARSARTTAPTATPGTTCRTTTPARAPTGGARTAWPASATSSSGCASALALWNGRDPILKERSFGLTGDEGNHGEDVKEYWWYLDAVPSHAWNTLALPLPAARVPLRPSWSPRTPGADRLDPEYELLDTGVFDDDRYWVVDVDYAKADPDRHPDDDQRDQRRAGHRDAARAADAVVPQHLVLGRGRPRRPGCRRRPTARVRTDHPFLGPLELHAAAPAPTATPRSCCSATTRPTSPGSTAWPAPSP